MKINKLSTTNIEIIKNYYPKEGWKKCSELTGLSKSQIQNLTHKLQIKIENKGDFLIKNRKNHRSILDFSSFSKNITKESAYVFGFLWADGSINSKNYSVGLSIQINDMDEIRNILKSILDFNFYKYPARKEGWKEISIAKICNKELFNFFKSLDFCEKSYKSADKVLSLIPNDLHKYFFRGLIDGDGCFYINEKQYLYQFNLASSIKQDWSYFERFLKSVNIKYQIKLNSAINKKGILNESSSVRITNKFEIAKLFDFLYEGYKEDGIGLKRKFEKALFIKNKSKSKRGDLIMQNMRGVSINGTTYQTLNIACMETGLKKSLVNGRLNSKGKRWVDWFFIET